MQFLYVESSDLTQVVLLVFYSVRLCCRPTAALNPRQIKLLLTRFTAGYSFSREKRPGAIKAKVKK